MIVLDASAAIEWLLQTTAGKQIENRIYSRNETLHSPHLIDLEVAQVLRRLVRQQIVTAIRAGEALDDWEEVRLSRYPHALLLPRIWQLRDNLSAYDAAYVALAEQLDAPLITRDVRLPSTPGHTAKIEGF